VLWTEGGVVEKGGGTAHNTLPPFTEWLLDMDMQRVRKDYIMQLFVKTEEVLRPFCRFAWV
jgi:hypothetical protein